MQELCNLDQLSEHVDDALTIWRDSQYTVKGTQEGHSR